MSKYGIVGLYKHNEVAYDLVKNAYQNGEKIVGIVHATGTGKSYIALQLAYDFKDKVILWVTPNVAIIEHLKSTIKNNELLDMKTDFPNLEFRTYQSLVNLSKKELQNLKVDLLILDEMHHLGAPVWESRINTLIDTHENLQIFGMSAYTVRDRDTAYERDMASLDGKEIFSNKIVSYYSLADALVDGVLPMPTYKSYYTNMLSEIANLEEKINDFKIKNEEKKLYLDMLKNAEVKFSEDELVKKLFLENIKENGKYVYFCPKSTKGENNVEKIMKDAKKLFKNVTSEDNIEFYVTTGAMGKDGLKMREAFYHDTNLAGIDVSNKLRVMFAIDQYKEGVHAPNIDGVIMSRHTHSDIVFFEQLGRALSVIDGVNSKKEPVVIDLAGNIEYIKHLQDNLKNKVRERKTVNKKNNLTNNDVDSRKLKMNVLNEEVYQIFQYVLDKLANTWDNYYDLATNYYEKNDHLNIPLDFLTINGREESVHGFSLGKWIHVQRNYYKAGTLANEKIYKLDKIGMIWDLYDYKWHQNYSDLLEYYKKNKRLPYQREMARIDGGVDLGLWISKIRNDYKLGRLSDEKIKLLNDIGALATREDVWDTNLLKLKEFVNKNGHLPMEETTVEEEKILRNWVRTQKEFYRLGKMPEERIEKLAELNIFESKEEKSRRKWLENYANLKNYYLEHHRFPSQKEKYRVNDVDLGRWLNTQKQFYKKGKLNLEQMRKLYEINALEVTDEDLIKNLKIYKEYNYVEWAQYYELAWNNYLKYGEFDVHVDFKTKNGIKYDEDGLPLGLWYENIRLGYNSKKIDQAIIEELIDIGLNFHEPSFTDNYNLLLKCSLDEPLLTIELNDWLNKQHRLLKINKLSSDKVALLSNIHVESLKNNDSLSR